MADSILMCCPACRQRWCGVVHPRCPVCRGTGLAHAVPLRDDVSPWIYARAVVKTLEWCSRGALVAGVKRLRSMRLLDVDGGTGLPDEPIDPTHRQVIGAAAGSVLKGKPLKPGAGAAPPRKEPKQWVPPTPEELREQREKHERWAAEFDRRQKQKEATRRAVAAMVDENREAFAERRENELAFILLEDLPPVTPMQQRG